MQRAPQFCPGQAQQYKQAHDLEAAGCRTKAATDKNQQEQHIDIKGGPKPERCGHKAISRDERHGLEITIAQTARKIIDALIIEMRRQDTAQMRCLTGGRDDRTEAVLGCVLGKLGVSLTTLHASGGSEMMKAAKNGLLEGAQSNGKKAPKLLAITQLTSTSPEMAKKEQHIACNLAESVKSYAELAQQSGMDGVVCSAWEAQMIADAKATADEHGQSKDFSEEEKAEIARIVGLGALKYFILKVDARKNMLFNPEESIDFNGNTGPFIQYTYARIKSILRKAGEQNITIPAQLGDDAPLNDKEIELIQKLNDFGVAVADAGQNYNPSGIANYCYELTKQFNQFYHDYSILGADSDAEKVTRLVLAKNIAKVIKEGMALLGIEVPERM